VTSIKESYALSSEHQETTMARPLPHRVERAAEELGEHLRTWRKLQRLTVEQVAERAGVSRNTVSGLERGDPSVGLDVVLNVTRAVGQLDRLVRSIDPYDTDLGRARADEALPQRVRR
jgi:transcriptional regulator with XRE-family HTH domain